MLKVKQLVPILDHKTICTSPAKKSSTSIKFHSLSSPDSFTVHTTVGLVLTETDLKVSFNSFHYEMSHHMGYIEQKTPKQLQLV